MVVESAWDKAREVCFKGDADPVTDTDHRSERSILSVIARRRPDETVVAEEQGGTVPDGGRVWLVDPLDGTTNFVHGFPWISISVALWIDNVPKVGVVVDVTTGDEYVAVAGEGARVNGSPISVSYTRAISHALVVTGFPYDRKERTEVCRTRFRRVLEKVQGIRRLGSAALDLCMVACGRMDGYWEEDLSPWDMGAGILLVMEAGGKVTDPRDRPVGPAEPFVVASNGIIHPTLLAALTSTVSDGA